MSERQSKVVQDRNERTLNELLKKPGNDTCADCGAKNPRWASYSLGVFLCIRCAGIHRKMGTHISKVKSITMDQWNTEQIDIMKRSGGNNIVNSRINPNNQPRPLTDDEHAVERYIRAKWEKRLFLVDNRMARPSTPSSLNPNIANRLQNVPKRSSSVPVPSKVDPLERAMNQLREMGFKNDSLNKQVLIKTQGNIEASVDILSRQNNTNSSINQMLTPAPASPALLMSDDQKLESLMRLGFTDMTLNRDVLRRAGGNLDIAMTILKEGVTNNNNNNIFQSPQPTIDLAGRAQTTQERQAYKLGGMNVSNGLVNVNDTSITSSIPTTAGIATSASVPNNMSAYNPFGLQQQQPQQQMLQQSIQPSLQQPLQQPQQQLQQQITFDGTVAFQPNTTTTSFQPNNGFNNMNNNNYNFQSIATTTNIPTTIPASSFNPTNSYTTAITAAPSLQQQQMNSNPFSQMPFQSQPLQLQPQMQQQQQQQQQPQQQPFFNHQPQIQQQPNIFQNHQTFQPNAFQQQGNLWPNNSSLF